MMPELVIGPVKIGGKNNTPLLIAGPCVLESAESAEYLAGALREIACRSGFSYIFKASYDKANRTSVNSYRGPGLVKGLSILEAVKTKTGVPVLSDVHSPEQARAAAEVLDVLQIPAFLCRQTDLLVEAGQTMRPVNIKKGQFLAPWDMKYPVEKVRSTGNNRILITERGTSFGYNNLVVDMRSLSIMQNLGCPVIFDATHSVQLPGGGQGCSSGQREFVPGLSRAALAAGAGGIFMEVHENPDQALCDGPNSMPLNQVEELLRTLRKIFDIVISGHNC